MVKLLAVLVLAGVLFLFAAASTNYAQTYLFKYNTMINDAAFTSKFVNVRTIGSTFLGVVVECNTDVPTYLNRFYIFDYKGKLRFSLVPSDYGMTTGTYITASSSGSFYIEGYSADFSTKSTELFIYKSRNWSISSVANLDPIIANSVDGNDTASAGIFAELKNESGKIVVYVYRF